MNYIEKEMNTTIINIQNPVNILQQPKAKLTKNVFIPDGNYDNSDGSRVQVNSPSIVKSEISHIKTSPFISDNQKEMELRKLNKDVNKIITDNYNKNTSAFNLSNLHKNISISCVGIVDDALNKPKGIKWSEYIQIILQKNQRYTYIGFLLIFIAIFILVTRTS